MKYFNILGFFSFWELEEENLKLEPGHSKHSKPWETASLAICEVNKVCLPAPKNSLTDASNLVYLICAKFCHFLSKNAKHLPIPASPMWWFSASLVPLAVSNLNIVVWRIDKASDSNMSPLAFTILLFHAIYWQNDWSINQENAWQLLIKWLLAAAVASGFLLAPASCSTHTSGTDLFI